MKSYFLSGTSWLALLIGMEAYRNPGRSETLATGSAIAEYIQPREVRRVTYYG